MAECLIGRWGALTTKVNCFIVGCSRSGTTLLSVLLDRHSAMAVPPETAFYRDLAKRLRTPHAAQVLEILRSWHRLPELGLDASVIVRACDGDFSTRSIVQQLLSAYAQARGKSYCGEKTPGHWRNIPDILADFPSARVLFLIRDGRDVALSLMAMPFWKSDLKSAADLWLGAAQACHLALSAAPTRVLQVRYEDLVTWPVDTLEQIMNFVGLPFEADQLNSNIGSGVVLARSLAWKGSALLTVDGTRLGARRRRGSPDDIRYLEGRMYSALQHFGYISS